MAQGVVSRPVGERRSVGGCGHIVTHDDNGGGVGSGRRVCPALIGAVADAGDNDNEEEEE